MLSRAFILSLFLFFFFIYIYIYGIPSLYLCRLPSKFLWSRSGFETPVMGQGLRPTLALRLRNPWKHSSKSKRSWPTSWPLRKGHVWVSRLVWRARKLWETAPQTHFYTGCWAKPTWMGGVVFFASQNGGSTSYIFPFRLGVLQWSRHLFNYWKNKKTIIEKFIVLLIWNLIYIDHRKITWLWS